MAFISGRAHGPLTLIHGGAGPMDPSSEGMRWATQTLHEIYLRIARTPLADCMERMVQTLEQLEDEPLFNAGYGAALQADGKPRLSAALMNGPKQSFSGVISVTDVRHPSRLALALQTASSRVLTAPGHEQLARQLGLPVENLITARRLEFWQKQIHEALFDNDTVGVVIWDGAEGLYAGTSTGGRGFEVPGRVSDSATVAGTFASPFAAVSATGIGEEIVDDGLCVRIETRVRDGMPLVDACRKTFQEAEAQQRQYGWIALDPQGYWCAAYTTQAMSFLVVDAAGTVVASS